jgi:hypothetical protein
VKAVSELAPPAGIPCDTWETAVHEAGHAIVSERLGIPVTHIVIGDQCADPDSQLGCCHSPAPAEIVTDYGWFQETTSELDDDDDDGYLAKQLKVIVAGKVAADILYGEQRDWNDPRLGGDRESAVDLALHLAGDGDGATSAIASAEARARELLAAGWADVLHVAEELARRGRIDRESLLSTIGPE